MDLAQIWNLNGLQVSIQYIIYFLCLWIVALFWCLQLQFTYSMCDLFFKLKFKILFACDLQNIVSVLSLILCMIKFKCYPIFPWNAYLAIDWKKCLYWWSVSNDLFLSGSSVFSPLNRWWIFTLFLLGKRWKGCNISEVAWWSPRSRL